MSNLQPPHFFHQSTKVDHSGDEPLTVDEIKRSDTGAIPAESFTGTHHKPEVEDVVVVEEVPAEEPTLVETVLVKKTPESKKKRLILSTIFTLLVAGLATIVVFNVLPLLS